jgi:hypothetical protein
LDQNKGSGFQKKSPSNFPTIAGDPDPALKKNDVVSFGFFTPGMMSDQRGKNRWFKLNKVMTGPVIS